ncbi:hypothetical protein [uncultured Bacteroides sp.]|uniref:hypothetical protein n=1 Tax=uncultured Bacteroides sp. TaxID=162156 RepID=UPI002AA69708|nr:hypothetical protein [uncultured Bacteroides sp.]
MKADARLLLFVLIMGFVNNACNGDPDNIEKPDPTTDGKVIFTDSFNQTGRIPNTSKWSLCTKNFALGGPDTWPGAIADSQLPARMEVDWVKVTQ